MAQPIVGIDLGTTNSVVAILQGDKPEVIPNSEGSKTTPSIVLFEPDGQVIVGELAKRQRAARPSETIRSIKSLIGRRFSEVKERVSAYSYRVVGSEKDQVLVDTGEEQHSPEEVSSEILRKMKESAESYLDAEVSQAVVTVPAYFNDSQRQATKRAGELAGLDVLRIINEPTAASLAYGLGKSREEHVAVFDFGGGTFDISILEIDQDVFEVRSTCGDTTLGGDDIDRAVFRSICQRIVEKTGLGVEGDIAAIQRVMEMAEKVKCELSTLESTSVNLPFIVADESGPQHFQCEITRKEFEGMISPLLARLVNPCERALNDAQLVPSDIGTVLLVGGSTRIPAVREIVEHIFGKPPSNAVSPDEAVALGAAIQAGVLTGSLQEVLLLDVTPLSLGIELQGGVFSPLIARNSSIPTSARKRFTTVRDNQAAVWIHVLQGERKRARENRTLGHFRLTGIPPAPREIPEIEVSFDIDANGILNVAAMDVTSGTTEEINIESYLQAIDGDPEKLVEEAEEKAEADRSFLRETRKKMRFHRTLEMFVTFVDRYQGKIEEDDLEELKRAMMRLDVALANSDLGSAEEAESELSDICNRYADFYTHKLGFSG